MKTIQPIRLFAAVLAGASLIAAPAEASSTNVNADADDLALYCSWEPDYAKAPGTFTFTASATCDGKTPDPTHEVNIEATGAASGNASGVNQATLTLSSVPPGAIYVTFSGANEYCRAIVHSVKVDIVQEREDYCIHGGSDTLDLTEENDSYLGLGTAYWYWSGDQVGSGRSYAFTPSEIDPCSVTVRAEAEKLPSCDDTCEVNIVEVDVDAEGCVCVTNGTAGAASRKQIAIGKCNPAAWDGHVQLFWTGGGGVKVYTDASGGAEVASGMSFANESLPTNLWVEGTAPSAAVGDVVFRLNPVEAVCPNAAEGCDRGTMTVVRVDVDVDGLAESEEETVPGGVVCVTNSPNRAVSRRRVTVQKAEPSDWEGEVKLAWDAGNVRLYTAASDGVEVASGTSFANAALPTNLWVEGTAASATAGDVILKATPVGITCDHAATGCDWARMTMILVDVDADGLDDLFEETAPGAFLCVTNDPGQTTTRKKITVQQVEPKDCQGEVELLWTTEKVKVYTAASNGVEVTSGTTFSNSVLPTNLWVEAIEVSGTNGDVIFRLNPKDVNCPHTATGCDRMVMTINKNVDLHPNDDDFESGKEGRVMISTEQDDEYYTDVKTTKDDKVAQTADRKVKITAHLAPAAAYVGKTVYFRVIDPDHDDKSSYETDATTGDNHATTDKPGKLSATSDTAVLKTINGVQLAAAEVEFTITDRYSGDNYQVECSLDSGFVTVSEKTSIMTAWKRIYVEEDQMYKTGSDLASDFTADGDSTPDSVTVTDGSVFAVNDDIVVFDADNPSGESAKITNITVNVLTLDTDLANSYSTGYGATGKGAAVAKPGDGTVDVDVLGQVDDAYGDATDGTDGGCFVEVSILGDGGSSVPYRESFGSYASRKSFRDIWFKNKGKSNYIYISAAHYHNSIGDNTYGVANADDNYIYVYLGEIKDDYGVNASKVNPDTTAHEIGHQFSLGQVDDSHPAGVICHEGSGSDYCLMSYQRDRTDGISEFCHDSPNHIDAVRDTADGL